MRSVRIEPGIVSRQFSGADIIALCPETTILHFSVGGVIEGCACAVLDGVAPESDESPLRFFPIRPEGVERLSHVGTISDADEPLQVERHLLASRSKLQLPSCEVTAVSNERLLEIERILIGGCDDVLAESSIVLQLHEDLPVRVRPDIGVKLQALDQVCIGVTISDSEGCDLRRFDAARAD